MLLSYIVRGINAILKIIGFFCIIFGIFGLFFTLFQYHGNKFFLGIALAVPLFIGGALLITFIPEIISRCVYWIYFKFNPLSELKNIDLKVNSSKIHEILGNFYLNEAFEYKLAIKEYSKAIELNNNNLDYYKYRSLAHKKRSDAFIHIPIFDEFFGLPEYALAVNDLKKAIALNQKDMELDEVILKESNWEVLWKYL